MLIFEDIDDPKEWYITKENAEVFLDCLELNDKQIDLVEFMALVGSRKVAFIDMVKELMQLLVFKKEIPFD
jgi:hypothetical protein